MAVRTHSAIVHAANNSNYSVNANEFDVVFQSAAGTLSIQQSLELCAFDERLLISLLQIINDFSDDVASQIRVDLVETYRTESLIVKISLTEFSSKCFFSIFFRMFSLETQHVHMTFHRINESLSSNSGAWAEDNMQWILLIIVVVMVLIMAIVVVCLLYRRRRRLRQTPANVRQPNLADHQPQGPGMSVSVSRQSAVDIHSESEEGVEGGQEGVEGQPANETGFGTIEMAENQ